MPPRHHPSYPTAPSYTAPSPHESTPNASSSHRSTPVSPAASRHSRHLSQSSSYSQGRGKGGGWGKGDVPPVPALPDFARRYSEKSNWSLPPAPGNYTPSLGGTSVAGTLRGSISSRRRRRQNKDPLGTPGTPGTPNAVDGEDWAEVEPDEVFRRLPVGEVKKIEGRMRSEALGKQSELRSMVGTRYRDLLTSASQITTLRSSSLRLSDNLKKVVSGCNESTGLADEANPDGADEDAKSTTSEGEEVIHMLPVAAHMKLLLDAPEALYALLSSNNFLQASFLWLLSRSTRESLFSLPSTQSSPYLHLLGKQWEILAPLRGAIAQRAGESLKDWEGQVESERQVAERLLGVVLVEGLGISDALALFLSQRAKAIKQILNHPSPRRSLSPQTSHRTRARTSSLLPPSSGSNPTRDTISKTLLSAVRCLLQTAQTARAVFAQNPSRGKPGKESLFEEEIRLIQKGENASTTAGVTLSPLKAVHSHASGQTSKHQRRASRLVSISLPVPGSTPSGNGAEGEWNREDRPPVSAQQILQTLPSSQILLRYLPNAITSFTPFITPGSSVDVEQMVGEWEGNLLDMLAEVVPEWLEGLKSVRDVWYVRESILNVLHSFSPDSSLCKQFGKTLEDVWNKRVEKVWDESLALLVSSIHSVVFDGASNYKSAEGDEDPQGWLFQDFELPFDNLPTTSAFLSSPAGSSSNAFKHFIGSLHSRAQLRTPGLDRVLSEIEGLAKAMREDLHADLPSSLRESYGEKVGGVCKEVVGALEQVLAQVGKTDEEGAGSGKARQELFVGRVALYLAEKSVFLRDLAGEAAVDREGVQKSLLDIHATSTKSWKAATIAQTLSLLKPLFSPLRTSIEITSFWPPSSVHPSSPSQTIIQFLFLLAKATSELGIPSDVVKRVGVVRGLLEEFIEGVVGLPGWGERLDSGGEGGAWEKQGVVDIGFLVFLTGSDPLEHPLVKKLLSSLTSSSREPLVESLPGILLQTLRQTQLLLHPLTLHLSPASVGVSTPLGQDSVGKGGGGYRPDKNAFLLRFGAPAVGSGGGAGGGDFRSPVPVGRIGKRMGLLNLAV
ncbi:hypothetical protein IAR50_004313 [Cryptococcus sp. DSM 104548]